MARSVRHKSCVCTPARPPARPRTWLAEPALDGGQPCIKGRHQDPVPLRHAAVHHAGQAGQREAEAGAGVGLPGAGAAHGACDKGLGWGDGEINQGNAISIKGSAGGTACLPAARSLLRGQQRNALIARCRRGRWRLLLGHPSRPCPPHLTHRCRRPRCWVPSAALREPLPRAPR